MDAKDKIEALKFISETHRNLHSSRIRRSYRILLGSFAVYLASGAWRYHKETALPMPLACKQVAMVIAVAILIVAINFIELRSSSRSDNINQQLSERAEDAILEIAELSTIIPSNTSHRPRQNIWMWGVLAIIYGSILWVFIMIGLPSQGCASQ